MSIVKYTNKKTGVVTWYESTSHYDPDTKQSRPIRKYLGTEDPVTGKLIPSSGKRGRKSQKATADTRDETRSAAAGESALQARIRELEKENLIQRSRISSLEAENQSLHKAIHQFGALLGQMDSLYASIIKTEN